MPPPYRPVGSCIYCGSTSGPLSTEHIIPENIGGTWKLPEASCQRCADTTSQFEKECVEMYFTNVRAHLDIRGRRQKRKRHHIRAEFSYRDDYSVFEQMPLHEHPGYLMLFAFVPPGIFTNEPPDAPMRHCLIPTEIYKSTKIHHGKFIVLGKNLIPETYARLLAKIAHSFAVAERGLSGFKPYLNNLVRGIPPLHHSYYVGGLLSEFPPYGKVPHPGKNRHEITVEPTFWTFTDGSPRTQTKFVTVRIRLFADLGAPAHLVVVGEQS